MCIKDQVHQLLEGMPEEQLGEVLEFARYLRWREEFASWKEFGRRQLSKAYGEDEPEYSLEDAKQETQA